MKSLKNSAIARDTFLLTAISISLQTLSLLLNIFITRKLGAASIGVASLIYSFYAFAITLANGNTFTSTSRFVSEEIGKGSGNVEKIVSYALRFSLLLSLLFATAIFIFAPTIGIDYLKSNSSVFAIRLMAISLPLATVGSCLKGYFHAMRLVKKPCIADTMEFFVKFTVVAIFVEFIILPGRGDIFTAIALSIVLGEIASCIYLSFSYAFRKPSGGDKKNASIPSFRKYVVAIFPIVINAYIFITLSSTNEALVPLTLKNFSGSTGIALSQYGIFEAIILPILFFPSIVLQSLSYILVPEIARSKSAQSMDSVRELTKKVFTQGLSWSILVAMVLFSYGGKIGLLACDDPLVGTTLRILCPVIPFIYLEIVLEGILKGLGMQNFSTVNSAVEYILRITAVVVCVPLFGFNGILVSYFVSNVLCNIVRIVAVLKATKLQFDFVRFLLIPILSAGFSGLGATLVIRFLKLSDGVFNVVAFIALIFMFYLCLQSLFRRVTESKSELV